MVWVLFYPGDDELEWFSVHGSRNSAEQDAQRMNTTIGKVILKFRNKSLGYCPLDYTIREQFNEDRKCCLVQCWYYSTGA